MGRRLGNYLLSNRKARQESEGVQVVPGRDVTTGRSVTVKVFDTSVVTRAAGVRELIKFEVGTMSRTNHHPNVVELVDLLASPGKMFVVMETVSGGDLFDAVAAKGRLVDSEARHYFGQLLSAIEHCHCRGVCHRDIKPENVLLDKDGNVKLTGFALAGLFDPSIGGHVANFLHATCGTPDYVAPEVVQGLGYDGRAADMWSLGVTLYVMLAGFLPFEASSVTAMFDMAQAGDFKFAPGTCTSARSLLNCLLEPDPEKRYTIAQVRSHPWWTQQRTRRQLQQLQQLQQQQQQQQQPRGGHAGSTAMTDNSLRVDVNGPGSSRGGCAMGVFAAAGCCCGDGVDGGGCRCEVMGCAGFVVDSGGRHGPAERRGAGCAARCAVRCGVHCCCGDGGDGGGGGCGGRGRGRSSCAAGQRRPPPSGFCFECAQYAQCAQCARCASGGGGRGGGGGGDRDGDRERSANRDNEGRAGDGGPPEFVGFSGAASFTSADGMGGGCGGSVMSGFTNEREGGGGTLYGRKLSHRGSRYSQYQYSEGYGDGRDSPAMSDRSHDDSATVFSAGGSVFSSPSWRSPGTSSARSLATPWDGTSASFASPSPSWRRSGHHAPVGGAPAARKKREKAPEEHVEWGDTVRSAYYLRMESQEKELLERGHQRGRRKQLQQQQRHNEDELDERQLEQQRQQQRHLHFHQEKQQQHLQHLRQRQGREYSDEPSPSSAAWDEDAHSHDGIGIEVDLGVGVGDVIKKPEADDAADGGLDTPRTSRATSSTLSNCGPRPVRSAAASSDSRERSFFFPTGTDDQPLLRRPREEGKTRCDESAAAPGTAATTVAGHERNNDPSRPDTTATTTVAPATATTNAAGAGIAAASSGKQKMEKEKETPAPVKLAASRNVADATITTTTATSAAAAAPSSSSSTSGRPPARGPGTTTTTTTTTAINTTTKSTRWTLRRLEPSRLVLSVPKTEPLALATTLKTALEAVGCACRVLPKPTRSALARVKACWAVTGGGAPPGEEPIVGVVFSVMASRVDVGESGRSGGIDGGGGSRDGDADSSSSRTKKSGSRGRSRIQGLGLGQGGGWSANSSNSSSSSSSSSSSNRRSSSSSSRCGGRGTTGGARGGKLSGPMTDVLVTLSTGAIGEFDSLFEELLASEGGGGGGGGGGREAARYFLGQRGKHRPPREKRSSHGSGSGSGRERERERVRVRVRGGRGRRGSKGRKHHATVAAGPTTTAPVAPSSSALAVAEPLSLPLPLPTD